MTLRSLNLADHHNHQQKLKTKTKGPIPGRSPQIYQISISVGKTVDLPVFVPTASLLAGRTGLGAEASFGGLQSQAAAGSPLHRSPVGVGLGPSEWKARVLPAPLGT